MASWPYRKKEKETRRQAWLASAASAEGLRRISKERSRKGPMPEGAHRDLMSDRGHGQGQTGGATALTRGSSRDEDDLSRTLGTKAVESRIRPKGRFGLTPGKLLPLSKANPYPKDVPTSP